MEGASVAVLIVFIVFGAIAAIVILPFWFRERTKQSAHRLISEAIAKGQNLDPVMMEKLTQSVSQQRQSSPRRTLGSGIVLLALGVAFLGSAYLSHGWDPTGGFADDGLVKAALILGCLGIAFTVLAIVDYNSQKKTDK